MIKGTNLQPDGEMHWERYGENTRSFHAPSIHTTLPSVHVFTNPEALSHRAFPSPQWFWWHRIEATSHLIFCSGLSGLPSFPLAPLHSLQSSLHTEATSWKFLSDHATFYQKAVWCFPNTRNNHTFSYGLQGPTSCGTRSLTLSASSLQPQGHSSYTTNMTYTFFLFSLPSVQRAISPGSIIHQICA